jgi:hypothetical protein
VAAPAAIRIHLHTCVCARSGGDDLLLRTCGTMEMGQAGPEDASCQSGLLFSQQPPPVNLPCLTVCESGSVRRSVRQRVVPVAPAHRANRKAGPACSCWGRWGQLQRGGQGGAAPGRPRDVRAGGAPAAASVRAVPPPLLPGSGDGGYIQAHVPATLTSAGGPVAEQLPVHSVACAHLAGRVRGKVGWWHSGPPGCLPCAVDPWVYAQRMSAQHA